MLGVGWVMEGGSNNKRAVFTLDWYKIFKSISFENLGQDNFLEKRPSQDVM